MYNGKLLRNSYTEQHEYTSTLIFDGGETSKSLHGVLKLADLVYSGDKSRSVLACGAEGETTGIHCQNSSHCTLQHLNVTEYTFTSIKVIFKKKI